MCPPRIQPASKLLRLVEGDSHTKPYKTMNQMIVRPIGIQTNIDFIESNCSIQTKFIEEYSLNKPYKILDQMLVRAIEIQTTAKTH